MVAFDTLWVGDRVHLVYGDEVNPNVWTITRLSEVTHSILVERKNASGKQVVSTMWVQPEEIREVVSA
jgi:hypothetical protein